MIKKSIRRLFAVVMASILTLSLAGAAFADGTVHWTGNGTSVIDGDRVVNTVRCGIENGAAVDGPYLLWILTLGGGGNTVTAATLTVNGDVYSPGSNTGNNWRWITDYYDPDDITSAFADYVGDLGSGNAVLTISHGCPPLEDFEACSPGFFRNHPDTYTNELFNTAFQAILVSAGWTLTDALFNPGNPGPGDPNPNPFNANFVGTGAYLSSLHVNYQYSTAFVIAAVQAAHAGNPAGINNLAATFGPDHVCPLGD